MFDFGDQIFGQVFGKVFEQVFGQIFVQFFWTRKYSVQVYQDEENQKKHNYTKLVINEYVGARHILLTEVFFKFSSPYTEGNFLPSTVAL